MLCLPVCGEGAFDVGWVRLGIPFPQYHALPYYTEFCTPGTPVCTRCFTPFGVIAVSVLSTAHHNRRRRNGNHNDDRCYFLWRGQFFSFIYGVAQILSPERLISCSPGVSNFLFLMSRLETAMVLILFRCASIIFPRPITSEVQYYSLGWPRHGSENKGSPPYRCTILIL